MQYLLLTLTIYARFFLLIYDILKPLIPYN